MEGFIGFVFLLNAQGMETGPVMHEHYETELACYAALAESEKAFKEWKKQPENKMYEDHSLLYSCVDGSTFK